jgi:succinate dehydrogenase / fumarate reductase flavoprotein subunit
MANSKFCVVGGGLAGLMAALKIAEAGHEVDLFSLFEVKRSHSACAQGGINASLNTKGQDDSIQQHIYDTIYGGDFLTNQPAVKRLCEAAPGIIWMFDRMGVTFSRTPEGNLDLRLFGGVKKMRTAFAGATTGQQLLYGADSQVRRYEDSGLVKKFEWWEFLSIVKDSDGVCRGITAMDLRSGDVEYFRYDAVIMATGGLGLIFGQSTNSTNSTGAAASRCYQQGCHFANGEFIQIHPTAIPGDDKNRLMSEAARGEGGRIWTIKDGKPWYFLEEKYPAYGNTVPRDIAAREIFNVVKEMGLQIDGEDVVYLDLTHKDPEFLQRRLGGILEIYEKFVGDDPKKVPMKIFPSIHYSMGGIWSDWKTHMTNIPGLFGAGECEYSYHGANRLGANSLLSAAHSGMIAGPAVINYSSGLEKHSEDMPEDIFISEKKRQNEINDNLLKSDGKENAFKLHKELGETMKKNVGIVRYNDKLNETEGKINELIERFNNVNLHENAKWASLPLQFARQVHDMMILAHVIAGGAYKRNESRGAHYKPDFPKRDDENWQKTTMAKYTPDAPEFWYEDIDLSIVETVERKY